MLISKMRFKPPMACYTKILMFLLLDSILAQPRLDYYSNSYQSLPSPQTQIQQGSSSQESQFPPASPPGFSPSQFFGQPNLANQASNNFNLPNPTNLQPSTYNSQYVPIKPPPGFSINNPTNSLPENYLSWSNSPNPNAQQQISVENNNGISPWNLGNPNKQSFVVYPNNGQSSYGAVDNLYKVPHLPAEMVEQGSTMAPPFQPPLPPTHSINPSFGNYAQQQNIPSSVTFMNGPNGVFPHQNIQLPVGNSYANGPSLPGQQLGAPQPPPQTVEIDQNNIQRYAQYLEILQKHYGIKMPGQSSSESNPPPPSSNTMQQIVPTNSNTATEYASNGYPSALPGPQPVPQPTNYNNFNSWPSFPNNYVPQATNQPKSAMSIVNNPMPALPPVPETGYNNYANIQQPSPHGQTYGIFPPPQQPQTNVDYTSNSHHVHVLPDTQKPRTMAPTISYPQYTWTTAPPTTPTTTITTTLRPLTHVSLERGEASTPRPLPSTTASTTSIQALTQQIRRLPAVLYVDSRNPEARKTEALLRETYGLPLVAFYVDKIDRPKTVERHLQQLTAHKGLPYLFICGTFIGSQQHIDNYHDNKQIPQLVEYVCGDEKKRKSAKSKKSSS